MLIDNWEEMIVNRVLLNPYIPQDPTPKQALFLSLLDREALYGGAAGGGKSAALLMAALMYVDVPGYNAILFRKTFSDLNLPEAVMARSHEWLAGTDAKWNGADYRWTFPSGATLSFGYLAHEMHKYRYQSAAFQFIGFDELTQFPLDHYLYLFSRRRRLLDSGVPIRTRGATNPGGLGHDWVYERFIVDKERPFVPAKLDDNPYIDAEEYRLSLSELDEVTRKQLEDGIWVVSQEGKPFQREWWRSKNRFVPGGVRDSDKPVARFQSWDTALTDSDSSAYTAMVEAELMHDYTIRITNVYQEKLIFPDLPNEISSRYAKSNGDGKMSAIIIEGQASGKPAIQTLKQSSTFDAGDKIVEFTPRGSKEERANQAAVWCKRGLVHFPFPDHAVPWLDQFESQLFNFPDGQYKDMVDAFSQLVIYLEHYLVVAWRGAKAKEAKPLIDSRVKRALAGKLPA